MSLKAIAGTWAHRTMLQMPILTNSSRVSHCITSSASVVAVINEALSTVLSNDHEDLQDRLRTSKTKGLLPSTYRNTSTVLSMRLELYIPSTISRMCMVMYAVANTILTLLICMSP